MQEHERVTLQHASRDFRRQGVISLVKPHIEGERVLDMRALGGELVLHTLQLGKSVFGLDALEDAVTSLNERASEFSDSKPVARSWQLKDLKQTVDGRSFDCVLALDILNHVDDDKETLTQIHEVLEPGGKAVFLVPAFPSLLGPRDKSLGHLRRYTRQQFQELLEAHGFKVHKSRYWSFLAFFPFILVEKVLKKRLDDKERYQPASPKSTFLGPLLRWWYCDIESRTPFPVGLSLFVIAHKQ